MPFGVFTAKGLDALLYNLEPLKKHAKYSEVVDIYLSGGYKTILENQTSQTLIRKLSQILALLREQPEELFYLDEFGGEYDPILVLISGLAAFNAFLQVNVTGPPADFSTVFRSATDAPEQFQEQCLRSLDYDGASVYQFIPHIGLFCLARMVFSDYFPRVFRGKMLDCRWMRMRINAFHQRLLNGMSGARLSDSLMLQDLIDKDMHSLEAEIMGPHSPFPTEAKVQFLLEKAQICIMQGLDMKAKEDVKRITEVSGFTFALSGALGKRTKFQQNDVSQLVVFAKSSEDGIQAKDPAVTENESALMDSSEETSETEAQKHVPEAVELNDDTLLEKIKFASISQDEVVRSELPPALASLKPDEQPQLKPLDQITLLTEATLRDTLSPLDKLKSERYYHMLLEIESHRSRTQERSVLQLQVIVDQIIADTQDEQSSFSDGVPEIRVTQFLPRAKPDESAPVSERLKYIFQLNTPTRWELETELAYAWSHVGSFVSALEIFKRLRLWAEVALCYHSVHQEDKARQVIRRQLYRSSRGPDVDKYDIDAPEIASEKWDGEIRDPPPPHAPRLWCILGDLDQDPACWERAWRISKNRYARAQRTLGEYYSRTGDLGKARDAYMKATIVNRQNSDTWSRLGDIDLKVGNWDGAIIAFQQAIQIDDMDPKTYSNLGSALLSKYTERKAEERAGTQENQAPIDDGNEEVGSLVTQPPLKDLLRQSLVAFKKGASIAYDNWQIWDNVITIAGRMLPPSFPDILLGMRAVIRMRGISIGESAIDVDVLRALVQEVISRGRPQDLPAGEIYVPPRGSLARATMEMVDNEIVPLITKRAELWALVEKLAFYKRDYKTALESAEKTWRLTSQGESWLEDVEKWKLVVAATDNLVSAYESYGPQDKPDGNGEVEKSWKMKARNAVRGILGKAKDIWEDTEEWSLLQDRLEELKNS
ncbi:hypothetical protein F5884DRAFT_794226 [Xylogone sp. PMI_703]|nr:hypothetical protein F5884DRAFT_794226 [Xylogone sp. PMI_703]